MRHAPEWTEFNADDYPFKIIPSNTASMNFIVYSPKRGVEMARWRFGVHCFHSHSGANITEDVTHYMLPPKPPKEYQKD